MRKALPGLALTALAATTEPAAGCVGSSSASAPATTAPATTAGGGPTLIVSGPGFDGTFDVSACTNARETDLELTASGANGETLAISAVDGADTLTIARGDEQDGVAPDGSIEPERRRRGRHPGDGCILDGLAGLLADRLLDHGQLRPGGALSGVARPGARGVLMIGVALLMLLGASTARSLAAVRVTFVQGEQNVSVDRPGSGVATAVSALFAGPTAAERTAQIRTYIGRGTPVRSVTQMGTVATVDLGRQFVLGAPAEDILARLSQVVGTATAVPGVTSVQVLIEGGTPLGLFPGVNATVPLTGAALRTPEVKPPPPSRPPAAAPTTGTRQVQERLAALGYLLPGAVDGQAGPGTTAAIVAFQKWEGLGRDGTAGPQTRARLARAARPTPRTRGGSGRRVEVLLDRQIALAIQDDRVVRALHVSTGKASTPTPAGSYRVYSHIDKWWSVPFREWLLWASPFVGGVAFHQFPEVPYYAASHGCVRVPEANARWLYDFLSVGVPVRVIAGSR